MTGSFTLHFNTAPQVGAGRDFGEPPLILAPFLSVHLSQKMNLLFHAGGTPTLPSIAALKGARASCPPEPGRLRHLILWERRCLATVLSAVAERRRKPWRRRVCVTGRADARPSLCINRPFSVNPFRQWYYSLSTQCSSVQLSFESTARNVGTKRAGYVGIG